VIAEPSSVYTAVQSSRPPPLVDRLGRVEYLGRLFELLRDALFGLAPRRVVVEAAIVGLCCVNVVECSVHLWSPCAPGFPEHVSLKERTLLNNYYVEKT